MALLFGIDSDDAITTGELDAFAADGGTFVIRKLSQGTYWGPEGSADYGPSYTSALTHVAHARNTLGQVGGFYHFLTELRESNGSLATWNTGALQCDYFVAQLPNNSPEGYLCALDVERNGGSTPIVHGGVTYTDVSTKPGWTQVSGFVSRWKALFPDHALLIYSNVAGFPSGQDVKALFNNSFAWHAYFLSEYADLDITQINQAAMEAKSQWTPGWGGFSTTRIWQFTSDGDVGAFTNSQDLNATKLSRAALEAMTVSGVYYFDSAAGSGNGTVGSPSPWSWATFAGLPIGTEVFFYGGGAQGSPKQYNGGGSLAAGKNYIIRNVADQHVQFLDTSRNQAFVFNLWTGGSIEVSGTGSIRFGPCASSIPSADTGWTNCALLLSGCQNVVLDGGANKKLIFNSASDRGLFINTNGSTGSKFITVRNVEATNNAAGIFLSSPGATSTRAVPSNFTGEGIVIEDCILHDNNRMGSNAGTADAGATGVGYERPWGTAANPMILRRTSMYNNHANSRQYGEDGIGFETFGAGYLTVEDCEVYECAGYFETGTQWNTQTLVGAPLSSNIHVRYCKFYGRSNHFLDPVVPPGTAHPTESGNSSSPGILLRDFSDSSVQHCTIDLGGGNQNNAYAILLYDDIGGSYEGAIDRAVIRNNIFVNRSSSPVYFVKDLPGGANAPVINYNIVVRSGTHGTAVADYVGQSPSFRSWAQWQSNGFDVNGLNVTTAVADASLWTDRANRIYTIPAISPARNAGVVIPGVNDDFVGSAPDIGFDEFQEPTVQEYVTDDFTRSVTNGWGTSPVGGAVTTSQGVAADYNVNGSRGTVSIATGTGREIRWASSVSALDTIGRGVVRCPVVLSGSATLGLSFATFVRRSSDSLQSYRFIGKFLTGGDLRCYVARRSGAGEILLTASAPPAALPTYTAGQDIAYAYECRNLSSGVATLRFKIWASGAAEPSSWDIDTTDSTASNQISGTLALFHFYDATITSGTVVLQHDDINNTAPASGTLFVVPGIIAVTPVVSAPTFVKGAVSVAPAKITQTAAPLAFSQIKQVVAGPPRITITPEAKTPAVVVGTAFVTPGVIAQTPTAHAPAMKLTVPVGLIAQTSQTFAPQLTLGVSVGLIDRSGVAHSPNVGVFVDMPLIDSSFPEPFEVTVHQSIAFPLINREAVVYGPVTGQFVAPTFLNYDMNEHMLAFAPSVLATNSVVAAAIDSTAQLYTPDVLPGAIFVTPALIAADVVIYQASVSDVAPIGMGLIDSTAVLYEPSLSVAVEAGYIEQTVAVHEFGLMFSIGPPVIAVNAAPLTPDISRLGLSGRAPRIIQAGNWMGR